MASRVSAFAMYSQNPSKDSNGSEAAKPLKKHARDSNGSEAAKPNKKRLRKTENTNNVEDAKIADSIVKRRGRKSKGKVNLRENRKDDAKPVSVEVEESVSEIDNVENGKQEITESIEDSSDSHNENEETEPLPTIPAPVSTNPSICGNIAADDAMQWILSPIATDYFFANVFEKKPFYISRKNPNHFDGLFNMNDVHKIIKENKLNYGKEIDVVSYIDGKREPIDNGMIALTDFVWNTYLDGNSIRLRNPQVYHQGLWQLCSLLQEFFSSCVGCNMYLTPENSQGFPPHWDDIDAFILQIEGKKHWKIYKPKSPSEEFPKNSSGDLEEDKIGEPILEQVVQAGDTLYIPRGYVHQAKASDDHSLHLTFSTNQLNTWSDLIKRGLEAALAKATAEVVELRKSLPKDYLEFAGEAFREPANRNFHSWAFRNKANELVNQVVSHFDVDEAADLHAKEFIHGCMPPCFNKNEGTCSVHWNGTRLRNGQIVKVATLQSDCKIRFIRKRAFRLVVEKDAIKLYHTVANSKNSKEFEPCYVEVDESNVPAICALLQKHPEYIMISDLPMEDEEAKINLADVLYYNGFLETDVSLPEEQE